jgi:hypothetical protein
MADDDIDPREADTLGPNGDDEEPVEEQEPDQPDNQDEDESEPQEPELAARQGRRADHRFQALNERTRLAEERARESDRRLDELLRQRMQPQMPQGETPAQREERRSRLTPEERLTEDQRDMENRITRQMQGWQYTTWENQDRALYEAEARRDPEFRAYRDKVEKTIEQERAAGRTPGREQVFYYLYGKELYEKARAERQKQRQQAARRVQSNTVRTSANATRSDVQSSRRTGNRSPEQQREERLSNVLL